MKSREFINIYVAISILALYVITDYVLFLVGNEVAAMIFVGVHFGLYPFLGLLFIFYIVHKQIKEKLKYILMDIIAILIVMSIYYFSYVDSGIIFYIETLGISFQ
jgi:hypothetical protein